MIYSRQWRGFLASSRLIHIFFFWILQVPHFVFICLIPQSSASTPIFFSHLFRIAGICFFNSALYHSFIRSCRCSFAELVFTCSSMYVLFFTIIPLTLSSSTILSRYLLPKK